MGLEQKFYEIGFFFKGTKHISSVKIGIQRLLTWKRSGGIGNPIRGSKKTFSAFPFKKTPIQQGTNPQKTPNQNPKKKPKKPKTQKPQKTPLGASEPLYPKKGAP